MNITQHASIILNHNWAIRDETYLVQNYLTAVRREKYARAILICFSIDLGWALHLILASRFGIYPHTHLILEIETCSLWNFAGRLLCREKFLKTDRKWTRRSTWEHSYEKGVTITVGRRVRAYFPRIFVVICPYYCPYEARNPRKSAYRNDLIER